MASSDQSPTRTSSTSNSLNREVNAADATLQKLREMNLSSSGGTDGSGSVLVRPSIVEPGSDEAPVQAPAAAKPAQVLPGGSTAAQQSPAAPPDPQTVRVGPSVVSSRGAEPASGDIMVGDHAPTAAGEDAGNAGAVTQPRASAGITTGFGLFGGGTSGDTSAEAGAADEEFADAQEEQPGIGSKIMTALGLAGEGGSDSPRADVADADATPHSGGGGSAGAGAGSRIMAALGLANNVEDQEVAEESEQAGAAAASADAQNAARAADRTAPPGGGGGGGPSHDESQPVSDGAASSGTGDAPAGGEGGRSDTPAPSAASASTQATGVTSGGKYEWVADLLAKMWPYVTEAVNKEAKVQLPPLIEASKPTWMGAITLHKFILGGEPPKLTDIRVVKDSGAKGLSGDDYIHLEVDFDWDSQQDVEMDVSPIADSVRFLPNFISKGLSKATTFRCGVENFEMFGQLMISFRPLMHQLPVIGAFQVCFVEAPSFDFDVTLGSNNSKLLDSLPMLKSWLYGFIADTLLAAYVLPDHYFWPMDPAAPDFQIPVGYVEVEVVEAVKVPRMDYLKGSDVYVELSSHKRGAKRTKVADKSRHPRWGESFKLPINVPRYQHITAVMWDEDVGADDEIGRTIFPVRDLKPDKTEDMWLDIRPLMHIQKDQEEEGKFKAKSSEGKSKERRHRFRKMLAKPIAPPDPEHKGTALHLRMTYRELSAEQVKMVMHAEQRREPITDPFLKELLAEDAPAGVVAGKDKQQTANPANNQGGDSDSKGDATGSRAGAGAGMNVHKDKDGTEMITERARPASADPKVARLGSEQAASGKE